MNANQTRLLKSWCETYKKGQLTLWILLALEDSPQDMTVTRMTIEEITNFSLQISSISLYRTLRRLQVHGLLDCNFIIKDDRPQIQIYKLSKTGRLVLRKFLKQNQSQLLVNNQVRAQITRLISRHPNKKAPDGVFWSFVVLGRTRGLEPPTSGTTTRRSNQLS